MLFYVFILFFSSFTFSWFFRWSFRRKALLQISHRNVLVCEWINTCLFNLNLEVNFLSQPWGFVSIRRAMLMMMVKYFLPAILHSNGVSPVWVYSCCFSLPGLENVLKHSSQAWAVWTTLTPPTSSSLSYRSSEYSGEPSENWPKSSSCSALSEGLSIMVRRWGKVEVFWCQLRVCLLPTEVCPRHRIPQSNCWLCCCSWLRCPQGDQAKTPLLPPHNLNSKSKYYQYNFISSSWIS